MLLNLHVKNFALIKEVDMTFGKGLNVITGETGAGKSLLLGCVNLALGKKFSQEMLRRNAESGLVELEFLVEDKDTLKDLEVMGFPAFEGRLIITRKIADGRSFARINGEAATAGKLREVTEKLINIHGQRQNQTLLKPDSQLKFLDAYGKKELGGILNETASAYYSYRDALKKSQDYIMDDEARLRELSILEYEISEIDSAGVFEGEEEELEKLCRRLSNARSILESLGKVHGYTGYDNGAGDMTGRALQEIDAVLSYDESLLEISEALNDVESILQDVNRQISSYLDEFNYSEQEFFETQERLDVIRKIKSKYGNSVEKINDYRNQAEKRIEFLINYEEERNKAEKDLDEKELVLAKKCADLTKLRHRCAERFSKELDLQLRELNFIRSDVKVSFSESTSYSGIGRDNIEILISTNPGEPLMPLSKSVSGGELSRIMLAVKNMLANEYKTESLIFDEIDSGISGRTAQKVSEKMAHAASGGQILCVTHLAQIAAMADHHYVIEKTVNGSETVTTARKLGKSEEIEEIARILGGTKITEAVRMNAKEMKSLDSEYKKAFRTE